MMRLSLSLCVLFHQRHDVMCASGKYWIDDDLPLPISETTPPSIDKSTSSRDYLDLSLLGNDDFSSYSADPAGRLVSEICDVEQAVLNLSIH